LADRFVIGCRTPGLMDRSANTVSEVWGEEIALRTLGTEVILTYSFESCFMW